MAIVKDAETMEKIERYRAELSRLNRFRFAVGGEPFFDESTRLGRLGGGKPLIDESEYYGLETNEERIAYVKTRLSELRPAGVQGAKGDEFEGVVREMTNDEWMGTYDRGEKAGPNELQRAIESILNYTFVMPVGFTVEREKIIEKFWK